MVCGGDELVCGGVLYCVDGGEEVGWGVRWEVEGFLEEVFFNV